MEIAVIAAVAENGVIGDEGELPWHYPRDLEHFKQLTVGNAVIIGRKTFEGIYGELGGPLPDRLNIVLTRSGLEEGMLEHDNVEEASGVDQAIEIADREGFDTVYIAGGASVYEQFLESADRMELTRIHEEYKGDTRFPGTEWSRWQEVEREDMESLSFITYRSK